MRPEEMIVATHLDWVWADLSAGVAGRWPLRRDRGESVPEVRHEVTAWWTPTAHAARLVHAGLELSLSAITPGWLSSLDEELTGRTIEVAALEDLVGCGRELPVTGFVKPSLAKLEFLPAAWSDNVAGTLSVALAGGVDPHTPVEVCARHLDIEVEHRVFVLDDEVSLPSPYRISGQSWEPEFDRRTDTYRDDAARFAGEVAAGLHVRAAAPRAYVLDVARLAGGRWVVIEANAAWASGTYGCPLVDVADAAVAASTLPADPVWRWCPDPSELAFASTNPLPASDKAGSDDQPASLPRRWG